MAFQEKSAWGLLAGIVLVSVFYFPKAFLVAQTAPSSLPLIALIVVGTAILIVIEVVYHTAIAVSAPRDAGLSDERDRLIDLKAERNASVVLGLGLFCLIGWILALSVVEHDGTPQALTIAVLIMLAVTLSEIAKLTSQIWFYRSGMR